MADLFAGCCLGTPSQHAIYEDCPLERAELINAELLRALDDLLVFHSPTHPRHEALHEEYAESCIANEISFSAATMLDDLLRAARNAVANARGEVPA